MYNFSFILESELEKLEVELTHQQEKMNEYEIMRNEINQIPRG